MGLGDLTMRCGVSDSYSPQHHMSRLNNSIAIGETRCCTPTKNPLRSIKALFNAFGLTPPRLRKSGSETTSDGLWVKGSKFEYKMATMDDGVPSSPVIRFQRANVWRESKANTGPFRATQIWNEVILHLKEKVELKRRRYKMRHYNNCFTGTDAVDVVLHYLLSDQETFSNSLSRDKAVKLCQTLMDKHVFESVSSRNGETKKLFEDSIGKFYWFSENKDKENCTPQPSDTEDEVEGRDQEVGEEMVTDHVCPSVANKFRINPDVEPALLGHGVICNPMAGNERHGEHLQRIIEQKNLKRKSSDCIDRRHKRARLNLNVTMESISEEMDPTELENLWKEVALCQLLKLIELPFLDGVLTEEKSSKKTPKRSKRESILSTNNVVTPKFCVQYNSLGQEQETFMKAAMECIEHIPQGPLLMLNQGITSVCDSDTKYKVFSVISDHYSHRGEAIFPERFIDLHMAIMNLVLHERDTLAVDALQLNMILLPQTLRDELKRLLRFMAAVAEDNEIQLSSESDNEAVVLNTFTDVIVKHKALGHFAGILVTFFVHHVDHIFQIPEGLREKVDLRVWEEKNGKVSPLQDEAFCMQISATEYHQQTEDCTSTALVQMMNSILDNTQIPLKEKKQKIRQFCKHHPHLYAKNFSGMV